MTNTLEQPFCRETPLLTRRRSIKHPAVYWGPLGEWWLRTGQFQFIFGISPDRCRLLGTNYPRRGAVRVHVHFDGFQVRCSLPDRPGHLRGKSFPVQTALDIWLRKFPMQFLATFPYTVWLSVIDVQECRNYPDLPHKDFARFIRDAVKTVRTKWVKEYGGKEMPEWQADGLLHSLSGFFAEGKLKLTRGKKDV